jgi:hypothetical protein
MQSGDFPEELFIDRISTVFASWLHPRGTGRPNRLLQNRREFFCVVISWMRRRQRLPLASQDALWW